MIHHCPTCKKIVKDNDKITVQVTATYHPLKSKVVFALSQNDMEVTGPVYHADCLSDNAA